ncbi:hypothetical protein [Phytopseudomonas punonensis]|uniref:Uncharacterized protein n=1 Tax=Phytopseudomonas punonensis TaxID=1220495 RepID=A0A1M7LFZ4_9GAMM|nr:hypothetical protein [Pseudomonas punonensis]SHM76966.1 hypothetical protein SAMN05216288_4251 [Pseudomonas punonensis]
MCLKVIEQSKPLKKMLWAVIFVAFCFSLSFVADFVNAFRGW